MTRQGVEEWLGDGLVAAIGTTAAVLAVAAVAFVSLHRIVLPAIARGAQHTAFRWDDVVADERLRKWTAFVLTTLLVRAAEPLVPGMNSFWTTTWIRVSTSVAIVFGTLAVSALVMSINTAYETTPVSRERPIKGYLQVVQIIAFVFGDIWVLAVLTNQTPWYLLSGLGAAAAVLLVLYRDTILSLSASMQMAQNDMVRVGDWIEIPEFGANGTVIDMALATVKVRNWDNTITTIPTHRLTSGSVKNWRGMAETGTRRIRFAILLDISSIRLAGMDGPASPDITSRSSIAPEFAMQHGEAPNQCGTNVQALCDYLACYLDRHPALETQTMTVMVRQLAPGPNGLPVEVYVFCTETIWEKYEAIQGEIISHTLGVLPRFGLRAFQHPTDASIRDW